MRGWGVEKVGIIVPLKGANQEAQSTVSIQNVKLRTYLTCHFVPPTPRGDLVEGASGAWPSFA